MCATMFDTCVGFGLRVARNRPSKTHTCARQCSTPGATVGYLLHLFTSPVYYTYPARHSLLHPSTTPLSFTLSTHSFTTFPHYTSLLHVPGATVPSIPLYYILHYTSLLRVPGATVRYPGARVEVKPNPPRSPSPRPAPIYIYISVYIGTYRWL